MRQATTCVANHFGTTTDGKVIEAFILTSSTGASATIITYGGIISRLLMPDRHGKLGDVALGFDSLELYETKSPYFGALIGRVGNRIAGGKFSLNGKAYQLAVNNGPNSLHGGIKGYDKRVWTATPQAGSEGPSLKLTLVDPDGTEGYPGTVKVEVTYTLIENTLRIAYEAAADQPTPINLTNHSYFNLKDAGASDVLSHVFEVNANRYTPVDATLIPTGEVVSVKGTPLDFTSAKPIGKDLFALSNVPIGYDHNLVLNNQSGSLLRAARVDEPVSGRRLEVFTTQPGMQFYTGNFLDGSVTGRGNVVYRQHHAFCLETQHFPDSVNHPQFPSTILVPGQPYRQVTEFRFSVSR